MSLVISEISATSVALKGAIRSPGTRRNEQLRANWREDAGCKGPSAHYFFPPARPERPTERARRERVAKSVCVSCAVRLECLETALASREQHGVWGGLNETERRQLTLQH